MYEATDPLSRVRGKESEVPGSTSTTAQASCEINSLTCDLQPWKFLQERTDARAHERVVIGQQDADGFGSGVSN